MRPVLARAPFDLANTFFAVAMLSFYFPLWVVETRGGKELSLSLAFGASMACVAALMPVCGAKADAAGDRIGWLRRTTLACVTLTALIGLTESVGWALALFACANVCYQLGTIFYDALLWQLASEDLLGIVSGLGSAFGYLGSMLGLLLLRPFVLRDGYHAAFLPSAAYFLMFAVPLLVLMRPRPTGAGLAWRAAAVTAWRHLRAVMRSGRTVAGLWRYCWASLFSLSAINTVIVFMAVYTRRVLGFSEAQLVQFFLFSQAFAVVGALSFGFAIRWWGAKRTLLGIWCGWVGALGVAAARPSPEWIWFVGPVIGFCLGSTWATARVLVTQLAPKAQLAEMFGLTGLFGRLAAILGPVLWGWLVWDPARYTHAMLAMIGLLLVGVWLLAGVRMTEGSTEGSRAA